MYWIPVIFIVVELIFIGVLDKINSYTNTKIVLKKYKDENLEKYISNKYAGFEKISGIIGLFLILEFIYFIVGVFYPLIWCVSVGVIAFTIFGLIKSSVGEKDSIEKTIRKAKLTDFECTDIKLQRVLKLNELKTKENKTNNWTIYIYPVIKIAIFFAIIILHYHFEII